MTYIKYTTISDIYYEKIEDTGKYHIEHSMINKFLDNDLIRIPPQDNSKTNCCIFINRKYLISMEVVNSKTAKAIK